MARALLIATGVALLISLAAVINAIAAPLHSSGSDEAPPIASGSDLDHRAILR